MAHVNNLSIQQIKAEQVAVQKILDALENIDKAAQERILKAVLIAL